MNAFAHTQYLEFLRVAGEAFSPMFPLAEPLRRCGHEFWCVEGLWQGSKVVRLVDIGRISCDSFEFEVLRKQHDSLLAWFPAAGLVRSGFKHSLYFDLLNSGRSHNGVRNRRLGLGNWAFVGNYLADEGQVITDRDAALAQIHRPAYLSQLAAHRADVVRLRRLLAEGTVRITREMCDEHPHLNLVLEVVAW